MANVKLSSADAALLYKKAGLSPIPLRAKQKNRFTKNHAKRFMKLIEARKNPPTPPKKTTLINSPLILIFLLFLRGWAILCSLQRSIAQRQAHAR